MPLVTLYDNAPSVERQLYNEEDRCAMHTGPGGSTNFTVREVSLLKITPPCPCDVAGSSPPADQLTIGIATSSYVPKAMHPCLSLNFFYKIISD